MNYTGLDDEADVELDDSEFEAEEDRSVRRLAKTLKVRAKVETDKGSSGRTRAEEGTRSPPTSVQLLLRENTSRYFVTGWG